MHYVMGDIHNEAVKLQRVLEQIDIAADDELIVLGDLFDRGGENPDPVGVYYTLSGIQGKCIWIRGNHDQWLADYIKKYYSYSEKGRQKIQSYPYNSFANMRQRMTEADLLQLADLILGLPLQTEMVIEGRSYLLAHAMTSYPLVPQTKHYYMMGNYDLDAFFLEGTEGYISICGHTPTANLLWSRDRTRYLDEYMKSIWRNKKGNVYLLDCGCGLESGRLACMCLETGERYYSD